MGNQQAKKSEQLLLSEHELKVLEQSFRHTSGGHTEKITENKLLETWTQIVDKNLAQFIANFLYTQIPQQKQQKQRQPQRVGTIAFMKYAEPYYIVERGSLDEQINFIHLSLGGTATDEIDLKQLEMYITSIVLSYLHIMRAKNSLEYESWIKFGYHCNDRSAQCFAKALIRLLDKESESVSTASLCALEKWLQINPTFLIIWRNVFSYLYGHNSTGKNGKLEKNLISNQILPIQEGLPTGTNYTPILDMLHIIYINSNVTPMDLRNKWRFLFSSKIMGESFSTMLGKLLKRGPTLLVVEDEDHYIFAGYAPESWALGPNFIGDDSAMLFTLSPAMRVFNATTYNNHYQYLNLNQQTMPNGLGMGGQFNYWGLWLDCEYGKGHSSESCTTFKDYVQLSKRKEFRIRNLEVWGIGDEPKQGDDSDEEGGDASNKRSILDQNLEDRVMLELSGRNMHSDGLREPDLDL